MKRLAAILLLIWGPVALAQSPASFTLTISPQQADLIGRALGEEPYADVVGLINQLNGQIAQQIEAAKAPPAPKPEKEPSNAEVPR